MLQHPCPWRLKNPPILLDSQRGIDLHAEVIVLDLLFQRNKRKPVIIITNTKFLPFLDPVNLLPKGFIIDVIKINATDLISPIRSRMRIALHDGPEPLPKCVVVGRADLIFQLMSVASGKLHGDTPFRFLL